MTEPISGNLAAFPFIIMLIMVPFFLLMMALSIYMYCRVFSKTGYSWAMGLLVLVPFGNIIVLAILAFGNWPILQQFRRE